MSSSQKTTFRNRLGAGTSNFDGQYGSLNGSPTLGSLASLNNINESHIDQTMSSTQKSTFRSRLGAGTSNFDGQYGSLNGTPTIPTNLNQLSNSDTGFISGINQSMIENAITNNANFRQDIGAGTSNFDGAYGSLSGTPTIPNSLASLDSAANNKIQKLNSSGNIGSSMTLGSTGKITFDPSNERILVED